MCVRKARNVIGSLRESSSAPKRTCGTFIFCVFFTQSVGKTHPAQTQQVFDRNEEVEHEHKEGIGDSIGLGHRPVLH